MKNELTIKKFKLKQMVKHPSIVIIAKRGSGKSYLLRALLYHFMEIPVGMAISKTEKMDHFYKNFFPDLFIYNDYDPKIIQKLLSRQDIAMEKNEDRKKNGKKCFDDSALIFMDDMLADKKKWANDPGIDELLFNGRHYNITYILTMQYSMGIPNDLRSNFDYVFLLAEDNYKNVERLWLHYAGMFDSFESFRTTFSKLTENYGAMVLVKRGPLAKIEDKVYWYCAPNYDNVDFMFGHHSLKEYHNLLYNEKWRKSIITGYDPKKSMSKKKQEMAIKVNKAQ